MQRWALACLLAASAACALVAAPAQASSRQTVPVPSLTPVATHALWERLVAARATEPSRTIRQGADDCRPARVVVYAQTDWLRAATMLAQNASPCAQYYISIPPLTGDKTQPRPGQAALIRALGPSFHALADISWNGWSAWVTANQSNWAQAGIVARQRMAAAGYDVAAGDTWAVNELTSAVRANTGATRQNVRDFVRGLFTGDGTVPQAQGVVFVIGTAQPTSNLAGYKANLQSWYQDAAFWGDMAAYVSDWAQEGYGDLRDYAVADASPQQRRDALVQYLGHPLILARVAPPEAAAATTYLDATYLPLGNAAWAWASSYGWTSVPYAQMQDFVSAQIYAERSLAADDDATVDRLGFAWAPSNTIGLSRADFTAQSAAILDRIGQAIRDSATTVDPADPGVGACGPFGQPSWCTTVVAGAVFPTAWQGFATWTPATLVFTSAPITLAAGAPAGPLTLQLQTGTTLSVAAAATTVTLSSTSTSGTFSTSPAGPWTPTLLVTIPAGMGTASVYYEDTAAGTPTITAAVAGQSGATQTETVTPGALTTLQVSAPSPSVLEGQPLSVSATGTDAYGNSVVVTPTWTVTPPVLGSVQVVDDVSTFVGGQAAGRARVVATSGTVSAYRIVTVTAPPPRLAAVTTRIVKKHLVVTVKVVAGTRPAAGVRLTVRVRRGSSSIATVTGRTSSLGVYTWRGKGKLKPRAQQAHYTVKVTLLPR